MEKLKILVADDSAVYRRILTQAVEATGLATVEHVASNGALAVERMENGTYDAALLDVNMPEMDGLQALEIIKKRWPDVPVIMISGTGGGNAAVTLRALRYGALDFIVKPQEQNYDANMDVVKSSLGQLFAQIRIRRCDTHPAKTIPAPKIQKEQPVRKTAIDGVDVVVIASSTGGPMALETVFTGFGENFEKPILLVQHMPPDFTRILAESLTKKSRMRFVESAEGDVVRAGLGLVAPGGFHMTVCRKSRTQVVTALTTSERVNGVRPSADVLFASVAEAYRGMRVLAVVLTGMGSDGARGVRMLKENCQCYCISQSEPSCVIYGMPRSVKEAGLSDEELDLCDIAGRMQIIASHGS